MILGFTPIFCGFSNQLAARNSFTGNRFGRTQVIHQGGQTAFLDSQKTPSFQVNWYRLDKLFFEHNDTPTNGNCSFLYDPIVKQHTFLARRAAPPLI